MVGSSGGMKISPFKVRSINYIHSLLFVAVTHSMCYAMDIKVISATVTAE